MKDSLALITAMLLVAGATAQENRLPNSSLEAPAANGAKAEVLRGMNGLVATPLMGDAPGLPRRLMGVGVDD